jgi:hypothetical protein
MSLTTLLHVAIAIAVAATLTPVGMATAVLVFTVVLLRSFVRSHLARSVAASAHVLAPPQHTDVLDPAGHPRHGLAA